MVGGINTSTACRCLFLGLAEQVAVGHNWSRKSKQVNKDVETLKQSRLGPSCIVNKLVERSMGGGERVVLPRGYNYRATVGTNRNPGTTRCLVNLG